jgi:hypothetical protein
MPPLRFSRAATADLAQPEDYENRLTGFKWNLVKLPGYFGYSD